MIEQEQHIQKRSISLTIPIAVAVGVSLCLVAATFIVFLQSNAYVTVKDIQKNAAANNGELSEYDTTSPVKSVDIDETSKAIQQQVENFDTDSDFGPEPLSSETLGL